jgi:pilus assembly protein CpaC
MWLKYKRPKSRLGILVAIVLMVVTLAVAAHGEAAMAPTVIKTAASGQVVELIINTGTSYLLECQGLSKVAVGDPAVADIVPVSTSQLLVNGKGSGSTNLFVWDRCPGSRLRSYKVLVVPAQPDLAAIAYKINADIGGTAISARPAGDCIMLEGTCSEVAVSQRAETIATAYHKNIKNMVRVEKTAANSADVVTALTESLKTDNLSVRALADGTVLVEGKVATQTDLDRVNVILANWTKNATVINLVQQIPLAARQVMVHCEVLEINRSDLKDVGVDWGVKNVESVDSATGLIKFSVQDQPFIFGEGGIATHGLGDAGPISRLMPLAARVNMLVHNNKARVLSQPDLLVTDGGTASMLVGGEIPIPVVQSSSGAGAGSVTIEWKEFGVRMSVKPRIGDQNTVQMDVAPEVSNLDFSNAIQFSGFLIPAIVSRKAQSTVQMQNGQSLLIGGLLSSEDRKNIKRIPLISKIPVIGEFFKNTSTDRISTELVILVTPEIVEPGTQPSAQARVSALEQKQVLNKK